jgi:membrane protease YdiL (CAAX protease family)
MPEAPTLPEGPAPDPGMPTIGPPPPGLGGPGRRLRDYGSWPAVILLLIAALAVAFMASAVIVPVALLGITGSGPTTRQSVMSDPWLFFVFILIEDLAFVLVVYVALIRSGVSSWRDMGLRDVPRGSVPRGLGWGLLFIAVSLALSLVLRAFGFDQTQAQQFPVEHAGLAGRIAVVVAGCVFAPVAEEIFFRGFAFRAMKARKGLVRGLLYSSCLFGVIHITATPFNLASAVAIFVPITAGAMILATAYERSGDLWTSIVAHGANNVFAFTLLFLSLGG